MIAKLMLVWWLSYGYILQGLGLESFSQHFMNNNHESIINNKISHNKSVIIVLTIVIKKYLVLIIQVELYLF